jgi:hypothetical protein
LSVPDLHPGPAVSEPDPYRIHFSQSKSLIIIFCQKISIAILSISAKVKFFFARKLKSNIAKNILNSDTYDAGEKDKTI